MFLGGLEISPALSFSLGKRLLCSMAGLGFQTFNIFQELVEAIASLSDS